MEDVPFSEGGTAQGAYSPYSSVTPPTFSVLSDSDCAQHTSDGNDQHSSRDARGDCATSQSSLISCAAATVPLSDGHDSLAPNASPRASAGCVSAQIAQSYSADSCVMHPDLHERGCGAASCAPAAPPHVGRALSASAAASLSPSKSIEDKPLIDFSDTSYPALSSSPVISGGAALSQLREAAPPLRTPHDELSTFGGSASSQPLASQVHLSGKDFTPEIHPARAQNSPTASATGGVVHE